MKNSNGFLKPTALSMALIFTLFATGCGGGGSSSPAAVTPTPTPTPTPPLTVVVPTVPGAGTGLGGIGKGPAPVVLGGAGNYVILASTAISTTGVTAITGALALSPNAAVGITGFGALPLDATGCFSTSTLVTGMIYAADYNTLGCTTPAVLTTAVGDMLTAYTDAAGRAADFTELGAGDISGMTLPAGTYKWSTGVLMTSDVTLTGGPNDVWIFEVAQDVTLANGVKIVLAGGALPKNIFWQVAGGTGVAIGTTAHMEGVILATKAITLNTGATVNGRLLAQTAVTLNAVALTQPAP